MKKVIFIIPYYGQLPDYFPAWLISAKAQKNIDFLLVTDLLKESPAQNIHILHNSFNETQKLFQSKFDFKISLNKPYKLCDYKPAYGYIFSEYLKGYDFWGYCDIDTVFGDLSKYLEPIMEKADVIGRWGHLSLFRNTNFINQLFMQEDKGLFSYKEVYQSDCNYAFDETSGMKIICEKMGIHFWWRLDHMADMMLSPKRVLKIGSCMKNYTRQAFFYDNGKLMQCYFENEEIKYKELMYLHFQKRHPINAQNIIDSFYIFFDEFVVRKSIKDDKKAIERNYQSFWTLKYDKLKWLFFKEIEVLKLSPEQRKILRKKRKVKL